MFIEKIGYGAGRADYLEHPNVLRLVLGQVPVEDAQEVETDRLWMVQTNLDDATGELIGPLYDSLFAGGALDVYVTPIQMKKNRPGMLLSVLVPEDKLAEAENTIFEHTPTFGIRRHLCHRSKLARRTVEVQTCYGKVRIKVGSRGRQELTVSPEFEDCRSAAGRHGVSPRQVYNEALACYRQEADKASNKQEPGDK
jgi:uncharacterized protein (DUF111 family)